MTKPKSGCVPFSITFSCSVGPLDFSRTLLESCSGGRSNLAASAAVYRSGSSWRPMEFGYLAVEILDILHPVSLVAVSFYHILRNGGFE